MLSSYAELQATVRRDLDRDDDNIESLIQRFIYLAEKQLSKRLKVMDMEASETLALTGGAASLPADYRGVRHVIYRGAPLKALTSTQAAERLPGIAAIGHPSYYYIEARKLKTYPAGAGDVVLGYYQAIPHLSDSNTTNWLLESSPELYLATALVQGFKHFVDHEAMSLNADWVGAEIDALNAQDSDQRFAFLSDEPTGPRP